MHATVRKHLLRFNFPGHTSRGTLYEKPSWFIILKENGFTAMGECSVIPGLTPEYGSGYEKKIIEVVNQINNGKIPGLSKLVEWPSIRFGLESALLNLRSRQKGILFPSAFTTGKKGIAINGLIWMGTRDEMMERIREKLEKGFRVLKLKVGSLDFNEELAMLKYIRSQHKPRELEIRLDANGAFDPKSAPEKLKRLSELHIHSIEQPIKAGQWDAMAALTRNSPIPVALDEELIDVASVKERVQMLHTINPHYIILKPSLLGGFEKCEEWISMARDKGIGWWVTSALESSVGLNAIAQWVFTLNPQMVQGLGTGEIFENNIPSPLHLKKDYLYYDASASWVPEVLSAETTSG
jgi:o-succinylbenzoate synthase